MAHPGPDIPLILMNDAALALPPDLLGPVTDARLVVSGTSRVRLALARLALPEAMTIWSDPGQSASLAALGAQIRAMGRLDRLVLAVDAADSAQVFSAMQTVITFFPVLKRGRGKGIVLVAKDGPALSTLTQFLHRLRPSCDRCGIKLVLRVREDVPSSVRARSAPMVAVH